MAMPTIIMLRNVKNTLKKTIMLRNVRNTLKKKLGLNSHLEKSKKHVMNIVSIHLTLLLSKSIDKEENHKIDKNIN